MSINAKIVSALKELNIPISYSRFKGEASKYIVFSVKKDVLTTSDDCIEDIKYRVYLNFFFKNAEDSKYEIMIEDLMLQNNFYYKGTDDLYDLDVYGKSLSFEYIEKREETKNGL